MHIYITFDVDFFFKAKATIALTPTEAHDAERFVRQWLLLGNITKSHFHLADANSIGFS